MRYLVVWKTRTFCRFPSLKLVEPSLFGVLSCRSKMNAILIMKFNCRENMCKTSSFWRFTWICSLYLVQRHVQKYSPNGNLGFWQKVNKDSTIPSSKGAACDWPHCGNPWHLGAASPAWSEVNLDLKLPAAVTPKWDSRFLSSDSLVNHFFSNCRPNLDPRILQDMKGEPFQPLCVKAA